MKISVLVFLAALALANASYYVQEIRVNTTSCSGGKLYQSVQFPLNKCIQLSFGGSSYYYYNETVVNSTYAEINQYYCEGIGNCPENCSFVNTIAEGCTPQSFVTSQDSVLNGKTENDVLTGTLVLALYNSDSTCAPSSLVQAQAIGDYFDFEDGICVGSQYFECAGDDINIYQCDYGCTSSCNVTAVAPNGGCWDDVFAPGNYFIIACGSLDVSTGTIPGSSTSTSGSSSSTGSSTTGTPQTPQEVCAVSNPADWTYGSGYYCFNGGSSFVQCWDSGNAIIQCPFGTSCQCAVGVECSDHGMRSPCTI